MEFNFINLLAGIIVILMLIPNIIYAFKNKDEHNKCTNKLVNILEQVGRYGCIVFMWLPTYQEFGFIIADLFVIYFIVNVLLLIVYYIGFFMYMKNKARFLAIMLAIIPSLIFLISGILLLNYVLIGFSVVFSIFHIYTTYKNL